MLGPAREPSTKPRARFGLRALVWAVLLAVLAVVLAFVPLFDVLGYDFCFALGLVAALAAVDVGHGLVARPGPARDGAPAVLRLCRHRRAGWRRRCWRCRCCSRVANALRVRNCNFAAGFALLRAAAAGDGARTRRPPACWPRWRPAARGRLVAFAHPGRVAGLDAAAPVPRPGRVRVRPVRRLLPGADLRRGAAPARRAGLASGVVQPGLDRDRGGDRGRRRRARLDPAPLAPPGRWPLALPLVAGVDRALRDGRQPSSSASRAAISSAPSTGR